MHSIRTRALGIGAAVLMSQAIGAGSTALAQGYVQYQNPTAARLNAVANIIQGQTGAQVAPGYATPYQQPAYAQPPTTYANGYVQPQPPGYTTRYVQPTANGYVPTQHVQPYATPYQQPAYGGYGYAQPQPTYPAGYATPYQQPTAATRYVDAVRSVVQPRTAPVYRTVPR